MSDDDTYPSELYVDEVDVYDYDESVWQELLDLIEWEENQTDYDRAIWNE